MYCKELDRSQLKKHNWHLLLLHETWKHISNVNVIILPSHQLGDWFMKAGLDTAQTDTHFIHTGKTGTCTVRHASGHLLVERNLTPKHVQRFIHSLQPLSALRTWSMYIVYAHCDAHPDRKRSSLVLKMLITQQYDNDSSTFVKCLFLTTEGLIWGFFRMIFKTMNMTKCSNQLCWATDDVVWKGWLCFLFLQGGVDRRCWTAL